MKRTSHALHGALALLLAILFAFSAATTAFAESLGSVIVQLSGGDAQRHTVENYLAAYASAGYRYGLANYADAMDGSNGNPDVCVPGLSSANNMIPQGLTYWPAKQWILVSSYHNAGTRASAVYALNINTGKLVAQFNLYKNGAISTDHVSGIAASPNNLYVASSGATMSYIPLSDLDVAEGTVKNISYADTVSMSGELNGANTSYASFGDSILWTGNFYIADNSSYNKMANSESGTMMLGYTLDGCKSSSEEWAALKALAGNPSYSIPLDSYGIDRVQCATVKNGYCYVGTSYGRKNDSNIHIFKVNLASSSGTITVNGRSKPKIVLTNQQTVTHLPMTEGLFVYDGYLWNIFESAAYLYNGQESSVAKNPTDVLWRFDVSEYLNIPRENDDGSYNTTDYQVYNTGNKTSYKISVPETIYLRPAATATTAQYYINNSYSGNKVNPSNDKATTGTFYFYSPDATAANSLRVSLAALTSNEFKADGSNLTSLGSVAGTVNGSNCSFNGSQSFSPSSKAFNGTITGLTLASGISATSTKVLQWTFTFTRSNGLQEKIYAYTIVYAPAVHSVGSIYGTEDYKSWATGDRVGQTASSSWISGIHGLASTQVEFGATANKEFDGETGSGMYVQDPITDLTSVKFKGILNNSDGDDAIALTSFLTGSEKYVNGQTIKYHTRSKAETRKTHTRGGTGQITIDTSRYTNLNQIPNLYIGYDQIGGFYNNSMFSKTGSHVYGFYTVASKTNSSAPTYGSSAMSESYLNGLTDTTWTRFLDINDSAVTMGPNMTPAGAVNNCDDLFEYGDKNVKAVRFYDTVNWSWDLGSTDINGQNLYTTTQSRNCDSYSGGTVIVKITAVNKSALRNTLYGCYNDPQQAEWDTANGFVSLMNKIITTAINLGTPSNSTTTDSAGLSSAFSAFKASAAARTFTTYEKNYSLVSTLNGTGNVAGYKVYSVLKEQVSNPNVKFTDALYGLPDTISDYTYVGYSQTDKAVNSAMTTTEYAALNTGFNTTTPTFWGKMTIPKENAGQNQFYFFYRGAKYNLTLNFNGGTYDGAGSKVISAEEGSTFPISITPNKAGYALTGWSHNGGGTWDHTTYTFGNSAATLTAQWVKIAVDDSFVLDHGLAAQFDVLTNDASGATLKSVTQGTGFTTAISGGKIVFTPTAALSAPVTFQYTLTYRSADYTAQVTVIPATNVYYEESFFTFTDGGGNAWQDAGSEYTGLFQNSARPGDADSPVYGFDAAYNAANESQYSLGKAKYVTVSSANKNKNGATATFTFTGTGFDLYAATTNDSGLAFVDVYDSNGTAVKELTVNTYSGYAYGQLYLDDSQTVTLAGGTPIYYAPEGQTDGTFFIRGQMRGWTTPTYYDAAGKIVTGTPADASKAAYAYGWVANGSGGVYQVPVISCTDLSYGTYTVKVEPRYSARQDLTGTGSYRFYVDAIRIYNPIDPATVTGGTAAYDSYTADGEYGATYQSLRELILDAQTFDVTDTLGAQAGVAFLETKDSGKTDLQNYENIGPNNELYLAGGQAVAFRVTTTSTAKPAKLSLGMRVIQGTTGTLQVTSAATVNCTVTGSTELQHDISAAVNWVQTSGSVYQSSAPIILVNTSADTVVISLTKLKWSYSSAVPAAARALKFSFAPKDLAAVASVANQVNADRVAADASGVSVRWSATSIRRGGTATLTISAPANFEKAFVNGGEIAGYSEQNGTREWKYTFSSAKIGKHAFDVTLTDENGYSTKAISAGTVEVQEAGNGQSTITLQALLQSIFGRLISFLKGLLK